MLSLTDLGAAYQQCLRDYLALFGRHRAFILREVERVIPAAVPVIDPRREDGEWQLDGDGAAIQFESYLTQLTARCRRYVEAGGGIVAWLAASQAARKQVLVLLNSDPQTPAAYSQSVILGLGLFLNLMTACVNQSLAERDQTDARFRLAFEAAPTGLIIVDPHGVIQFANAQTERMFGYSQSDLAGRPIEILIPERLREAHRQHRLAYSAAPSARAMGAGRELHGRRRDGSEFPIEIGLNPSRGAKGLSILAVIVDITERKRTQEALVQQMWELQRSNEDLEQFAYVASHDLQEPLRMVVSYTTLLADRYRGKLDEKADKFIRYAVEGATRMQQLVADLLAYSRVGSQGKPPRGVSAQTVFDRTLDGMRRAIEESGARIVCDPLPNVLADDVQLAQLFQNLISNALKFHGERPPDIHVSAQRAADRWQFAIADQGIGIDMEHAERIFQMFQRLHERGKYEGSGIGLTIAKKIVERHRGRIWCTSVLGQGSTFFFTLPVVPEETP